jgi:cytochrome c553
MKKITLIAMLLAVVSTSAMASNKIEAGKVAAAKFNCASCHGADYSSPIDPSYPKLAGQHKDYLAQALKAYKRGPQGLAGRSNAIMEGQVKELTNADIENISAYLQSLPSQLVLKK